MKLIVLQIARLVGALVILYGAALIVSLLLVPSTAVGVRLDTARAAASLFLTEPKYVFMTRSQLNTEQDKVLLLGASNVLAGLRQEQIQPLVPDAEVHNLAVGGSNMTELEQIVALIREVQTPAARRHNRYVFGLWYGLFADDTARWYTSDRNPGDTDIDIERYRYGFYRRTERGPVPVLPASDLDTAVLLIHPYLVLDRTTRDLSQSLRAFLGGKPAPMSDEDRNQRQLSASEQREYLAFWSRYMGGAKTLTDTPFETLERTVNGILAEGGQVVLVDLPIPEWHAQGSPLARDYRARIDARLGVLQSRPEVSVLRLAQAGTDTDFQDEVHPKPRVAPRWARQLSTFLNTEAATRRARPPPTELARSKP